MAAAEIVMSKGNIMRKPRVSMHLLLCVLCLAMAGRVFGDIIPDFTKGEEQKTGKKDTMRPRVMGPTGLWGITYAQKMKDGATRDARQFLITQVDPGSPADGKILAGDVVLGIDGQGFSQDARKALAAGIHKAEETDGKLSLRIWREGNVQDVALMLEVLGAYDRNNPYDCPHTKGVVEALAQHAKQASLPSGGKYSIMFPSLYALGMLATGREDLMPKVKKYAHSICHDDKGEYITTFDVSSEGKRVWRSAYKLIFLSEYFMATGDEVVRPYLKTLAVGAASGQSGAGTYGHRFSSRMEDGGYHGPLEGYGAMNQAAFSMMTGLLLAQKCGIEDPEISQAIARGKRFFDFFVDHGAIPYGDHWALYDTFDNNGTSGVAAIMYQLMGDNRGQEFFSSMIVASAPTGREEGHQGCYWTALWGELGAARAGREALLASTEQMRYIRTLERHWSGMAYDQGNIGPDRYGSRGDVTGSRLLLFSLGKRNLYLTGKDITVANPLTGEDLKTALIGGLLICNQELRKSIELRPLLRLLGSKLTPTRMVAAKALQERKINQVDLFIKMLGANNRFVRYGACNALSMAGFNSTEAVDAIIKKLQQDDDILFRYFAVDALNRSAYGKDECGLKPVAAPAVPTLLELASQSVPGDPRDHLAWQISEALFYSTGLYDVYVKENQVDDELLASAVVHILENENGRARSMVPFRELPDSVRDQLWDHVITAVRENAPSGIMFSKGVREEGLKALAKDRIKEGLDLMNEFSVSFLKTPQNDEDARWVPWFGKTLFEVLPEYGKHAEPVLAVIEQWPVLGGRGAELAKQLPAMKEKMAEVGLPSLKSIAK